MGTRYSVKVVAPPQGVTEHVLRTQVEDSLARIDRIFSTYRPDSEISRFNAGPAKQWQAVSPELVELVATAQALGRRSQGAFDITMLPLARLWGLGPQWHEIEQIPADDEIARARALGGPGLVQLRRHPPALRKEVGQLEIDLNALVAGYAADQVALLLEEAGVRRYLVDMGGEMRLSGANAEGKPWAIGIEQPQAGASGVLRMLTLTDCALATSGSYQNFIEVQGQRYPHVLDARSGRPIQHSLVSVTVLARTAVQADAWATVLLILGEEAGSSLAQQRGLSALMVIERAGVLRQLESPAFGSCPDSPMHLD